ncbi:hypothetical protein [Streptomyces sp. NPDC051561]|uniref:hypothetical protein n=1 Tax=Streptomyces sp. NPDC051561 TaxID=3365658 RepID=UPI00378CEEC6
MVLTGEISTHVPGPRRKNLLIVAILVVALLGAAAWALTTKFNEKPVWVDNVGYDAGYYHGIQLRKTDRTGEVVAKAVAGGCRTASTTAGKKADDSPEHWVRGCLDAVRGLASNPNEA